MSWTVGGTDGNLFTIDERGQFSFKETNPPDFDAPGDVGRDNLYNVTIQARDPESNTASQPVTVTVTEVNEGTGDYPPGQRPRQRTGEPGPEYGAGQVHGLGPGATKRKDYPVEHLGPGRR